MAKQSSQPTETSLSKTVKLPDLFSLLNAASGLLSIYFSIHAKFILAIICLLIAVVFDTLDGKIATMLNLKREFGMQMDSLSDIVSFGVAPAVFGIQLLPASLATSLVLIVFVLCGLLRLARFNTLGSLPYYIGLPITTNGYIIPLFYFVHISPAYFVWVYALLAVLMVSPFRIPKPFK